MILIVIAAGAIAATRAIADRSRRIERAEAAEWFARGQARLATGDAAAAVTAFRRAALKRRGEEAYVLALADALMEQGDVEAAERALVAARAAAPEDPEINLALARVGAVRQELAQAVRYYHNALYAPWPDPEARRQVRLELIRFLIDHRQTSQAIAELIGAAPDTPPSSAAHIELAGLFARAGDARRALDLFKRALERDADSVPARTGAGRAAFALGDYAAARRYLQSADDEDARQLATVAEFVLTRDPLASRISGGERRRRVDTLVAHVRQRVHGCLMSAAPGLVPALTSELAFLTTHRRAIARDDDILEAAVELASRVSTLANAQCGESTALDRALIVIAERHGLGQP